MSNTLKHLVYWVIVFALSFLLPEAFGWDDRGKAFFALYFLIFIEIIVIGAIVTLFSGRSVQIHINVNFLVLALALLAIWGIKEIFRVDFYVAFQIVTFVSCFLPGVKIS